MNYGLRYVANKDVQLQGYTNADWGRSVDDRKSTLGVCSIFGSAMISWMSRKQRSVALNIVEEEYIAANEACTKAVWLRKLFARLFDQELEPTVIHRDNQSCVKLLENPMFHDRLKHMEIKYHIHDMVQRRVIRLEYISVDKQTTDILMKLFPREKFVYFRDKLGLVEITPLTERECCFDNNMDGHSPNRENGLRGLECSLGRME